MNRVVITQLEHRGACYTTYIVLNGQREFVELQMFAPEEETIVDNIYVGYVEKVVPSVRAAFVRICEGRKCYLPLEDFRSPIYVKKHSARKTVCEGDELLVQVVRDAVKTKDAVASAKLTIHGICCLLTTDNTRIGVSRKIGGERAAELTALVADVCAGHESRGFGLVLRTNAGEQSDEAVRADIEAVIAEYERILTIGIHRMPGELVHRHLPGFLTRLKGQELSDVDCVYTDVPALYDQIRDMLPALLEGGKLKLYNDPAVSLAALYNIRGTVDNLLKSRVWLPSGANIIIETLETLTVIDVNSGKNTSKKKAALFAVNLEAAKEIARQLRLRNINGMILVDFINMESGQEQDALISCLKEELKKDSVPARFIDITKLGLVEITRKKVYKSLQEMLGKGCKGSLSAE